jgi:hypothetical protein
MRERVWIIEVAPPFQWKPGRFESRIVRRYWWGWFAVTRLRIPLDEFVKNEWDWIGDHR